ncbi:MAG: hypothetical protein IJ050_07310 [Clostridia bacterium]|nr:hypothetical protein [Clostridia bacterium]
MNFEKIGSLADCFMELRGQSFDADKRVEGTNLFRQAETKSFDPDKRIDPELQLFSDLKNVFFGFNEYSFNELDYIETNPTFIEIVKHFKLDEWQSLPDSLKKEYIKELVNRFMDLLKLDQIPEIEYYSEDDMSYGGYNGKENKLYLNEKFLDDPMEMIDTIVHEIRHAYQFQHALNPETYQDYLYALNYANYIRPCDDYFGYRSQLVESEAYAFANQVKDKVSIINGGEN